MAPQRLNVVDEMPERVVLQRAQGQRPSGAALIENDDAVMSGIEEAAMGRGRARAGPAMQKQDRHAMRIARLLPIHRVTGVKRQHPGREGFDRWEKILAVHALNPSLVAAVV